MRGAMWMKMVCGAKIGPEALTAPRVYVIGLPTFTSFPEDGKCAKVFFRSRALVV
jgi:hypothetical protein